MPSVVANGITIEYALSGPAAGPALLLVNGVGGQLTAWDDQFVRELSDRGFHVIRFDNRDVGFSTWFDDAGTPDMVEAAATWVLPDPAYTLADMADDAVGLLDGLGVDTAHVVGLSMGGMIAQDLVIRYPHRVLSLVSIMSTTGDPGVGGVRPDIVEPVFLAPHGVGDRQGVMDGAVKAWIAMGSSGFPCHEDRIRARAAAAYDRAFHPAGSARQLVAIVTAPDRTPGLRQVTCPTLVVHGDADPVVDLSGGQATADGIPGAELWTIPGMGHDLPPEVYTELASRIAALCLRSK
jgi:pimeloyl-ACP methyl ester carboxylesterase